MATVALAHSLAAQATGTLDLGLSRLSYDGFLPSAAIALTPALVIERPRASFALRGTYLVFESGNHSIQGAVTASAFRRLGRGWRAELWGLGGGSRYATFASFWHALGGARAFRSAGPGIVWADLTGGTTSYGSSPRPVVVLGTGLWTAQLGTELGLSASHARIGDTVYTDFRAQGRYAAWGVLVQGEVGARVWSRGGGRGVYAEATATLPLGDRWAVIVAGGRYPTDPARGSISGRYVSAAMRLAVPSRLHSVGRFAARPSHAGPAANGSPGPDPSAGPWLVVRPDSAGAVRLRVHAAGAASVEIAGDFTDWTPVTLRPAEEGAWEIALTIAPGVHRINIRLDGGPWVAPRGSSAAADDFGTETGLLVVR